MEPAVRRFACTQCGKCCNRPPEVELSEAAALADTFVFRLMFGLHWLPQRLADYRAPRGDTPDSGAIYYGKKRLLGAFAARKYSAKRWRDGKPVRYTKYLRISALSLDTRPGACSALIGNRCGIYDRRPLSCRSVPFHYSRSEAAAEAALDAFVGTSGYRCDTGDSAEVVIRDGRIVARGIEAVRSEAVAMAERDRRWSEAIVRRMNDASRLPLPKLETIEANADMGATTASMRVAWRIAADVGLIGREECERLTRLQLHAIDRALAAGTGSQETRKTLVEMQSEYRYHLTNGHAVSASA